MNSEHGLEVPKWHVIYTHPRQEERAENNLRTLGIESFNPKIRESRRNSGTGQTLYSTKSFFLRYIFARFDANQSLRKVSLTRGVNKVVCFGGRPAPVEDEIIDRIKAQIGEGGFVQFVDNIKIGDKVRITEGPFGNFVGVFDRKIKSSNRVMILLATVNFQGHVITHQESIQKIPAYQSAEIRA